jgi:hypothetical protein
VLGMSSDPRHSTPSQSSTSVLIPAHMFCRAWLSWAASRTASVPAAGKQRSGGERAGL